MHYSRKPASPHSSPWLVCLAAACVAVTLAATGCDEPPQPADQIISRVKVYEVSEKATGQSRRISGKLESPDRSTLSFGVTGRIEEIACDVGQVVVAGEILALLDDEPLRIALENARATLSSSRADHLDAQTTLARVEELFVQGVASQSELDRAQVGLARAEGDLQTSSGTLAQADLDFNRTRLVAPYAGLVVSLEVDDFQEVGPSTPVIVLQSDESLEVQVRVPETLIRDVQYGQIVQVQFPSLDGVAVSGTVVTIGAESETGNAFPVAVRLSKSDEDLRAGMTASVTFLFDAYLQDRVAYLIPLSSISVDESLLANKPIDGPLGSRQKTASVYVLNPQNETLGLREITTGDLRGNKVEVFEGLEEGELVVSAGVSFLHDGMTARQWTPSTGASDDE